MPSEEAVSAQPQVTNFEQFEFVGTNANRWATAPAGMVSSAVFVFVVSHSGHVTLGSDPSHEPGICLRMTNGSAANITVPANADWAFPPGHQIPIIRTNAQITIVAASGVTIRLGANNRDNSNGVYSMSFLLKIFENEWIYFGDTSST